VSGLVKKWSAIYNAKKQNDAILNRQCGRNSARHQVRGSFWMGQRSSLGNYRGVLRAIVGHGAETLTDGYVVAQEDAIRTWLGKLLEHASTWPGVPNPFPIGVLGQVELNLARLKGLEPPTSSSGGKRSIH
jgi:hypothetical protein